MIKRMVIMLIVVIAVLGGMIGFKMMGAIKTKEFLSSMPVPAQTVSTIAATTQEWQQELNAVGTLRAVNGADLSSEVAGIIDKIPFDSGMDVEKDAMIAHMRDEDEVAQLHALEAAASLAQTTLDRDNKQLKAQAVSQSTIDSDAANLASAKAQVAAQQAIIDKKTIRAPFAGHLGIRQVDVGQYLNPGTAIVTLQQLDPIYVDFNLPEQALPQIAVDQTVVAHIDGVGAAASATFDGKIVAVNAKVDEATRNIQVRAEFKNADHRLLPGIFAHVVVTVGEPQKLVTLPQTAITYNPYGDTVYVVAKDDNDKPIAQQVFVTLGATRGDQVVILTGVKDGDQIVTTGQLKLRNGIPLVINNDIKPSNDINPKPQDR